MWWRTVGKAHPTFNNKVTNRIQRWSRWKKYYQLFLVALYACAFSYGENTLGAAWTTVSEDTGVTLVNMNAGSALNYLLLVSLPLFLSGFLLTSHL